MRVVNTRTAYIGSVAIADGFTGHVSTVHLCIESSGRILAVAPFGWFTFAHPAEGVPALPVVSV